MSAPYFSIMKLQILITQYKENEEVIKPLLDSIAIQQGIDFNDIGVVICSDGGEVRLSEYFLNSYKFHIDYFAIEHGGVSAARNALMDYATAEYIMFCDCDDMFVSNCGLYQIIVDINSGFDSLTSTFIEEYKHKDGRIVYVSHSEDATFIHGKVHRKQYLVENNIRWNENLTIHEDSFFNILAQAMTDRVRECKNPYYLWKWRDDSVCRHDDKYMLKTYDKFIDSNDALIDEFVKRGILDKAMFYFVRMVFETYYTMNKPEWLEQENQEYRKKTEKRFAEHFRKHKDLWDNTPMVDKVNVSDQARGRIVKQGMLLEATTIFKWLEEITGEKQCLQENKEVGSGRKNV